MENSKVALTFKAKILDTGTILMLQSAVKMCNIRANVAELDSGLFVIFGKEVKKLTDKRNPFGKLLLSYGMQPSVEIGDYQEEPALYISMNGRANVKYFKPPIRVKETLDPYVDWGKTPSYFAGVKIASDPIEKGIRKFQQNPEIIELVKSIRGENPEFGFTNGSCVTFAKILLRLFKGEMWYLAVYEENEGWSFQHAYCKINGKFYDASGQVSEAMLLDKYGSKSLENKVGPASLWSPMLDYILNSAHDPFLTYAEIKVIEQVLEESFGRARIKFTPSTLR